MHHEACQSDKNGDPEGRQQVKDLGQFPIQSAQNLTAWG